MAYVLIFLCKYIVWNFQNLPVTRIVDELMEMKGGGVSAGGEEYRYLDPKQLRPVDGSQIPKGRAPFTEAFVFIVGGGNYIEYQNLVDYCKVRFF